MSEHRASRMAQQAAEGDEEGLGGRRRPKHHQRRMTGGMIKPARNRPSVGSIARRDPETG